ncbi:MAG: lysine--tRNA ligase [Elusimicrobia bacterium]|nr:lysine--tRNA ligase [Elusimicrobiota bacterium]
MIQLKTEKVRELRKRGIDPFPIRFSKKDLVSEIVRVGDPLSNEQHSGKELTTAGRIVQLRLMGKAAFFHLLDGSGKGQVYARLDTLGEPAFALLRDDIQIGDFVGVSGEVFKTKTGEPTLNAKSVTLLAKALRPLPEKWHGLKDTEVRYRQRHLDLISNPEVRAIFEARSKMVHAIRRTFHDLGYLEVETPILLTQAGGATATPFETFHRALDAKLSLRIATELNLKRLIVGGFERVYEIGRIFRNEGIDTRHNPEFTTIEAYEAYGDYHTMMALVERLFTDMSAALGVESIDYRGSTISLKPPFRRLYMPEMWKDLCGEDIHNILKGKGFDRAGLVALGKKLHIESSDATPSAKIFERIFDAKLLPELVQPAFVLDHPTAITPLAKCKPGDESLVERFEFFLGTDELANAYSELNDPLDQRERLEEQMRQKAGGHEEADILDEDFVHAMEVGMPPTGGIGIGVDRLAMILTGHPSIREVILFPTLKAEAKSEE